MTATQLRAYVRGSKLVLCGRKPVRCGRPGSSSSTAWHAVAPASVYRLICAGGHWHALAGTSPPTEPMNGREVTPSKVDDSTNANRSDPGGGSNMQPWKTALAVVLPVLVVALLGYQVRCSSSDAQGAAVRW